MKSDTARCEHQIILVAAIAMGEAAQITKLLQNVSVIPKLSV
jgi:hypothetical protein